MASPDCCESQSSLRSISHGGSYPRVGAGKVFTASPKGASTVVTTPYDHRGAGPHCRVILSGIRSINRAGSCPTVRARIVSAASVQSIAVVITPSAPDNHLVASPYRCVTGPRGGRVASADHCPTVRAGVVSTAAVHSARADKAAPNDHFASCPHRCVIVTGRRRTGKARRRPVIRTGIISAAGVEGSGQKKSRLKPAPDDHFTTSPHRSVTDSAIGRARGCCPCILSAAAYRIFGKRVVTVRDCYGSIDLVSCSCQPWRQWLFQPCHCSQLQTVSRFGEDCCRVIRRFVFLQ